MLRAHPLLPEAAAHARGVYPHRGFLKTEVSKCLFSGGFHPFEGFQTPCLAVFSSLCETVCPDFPSSTQNSMQQYRFLVWLQIAAKVIYSKMKLSESHTQATWRASISGG